MRAYLYSLPMGIWVTLFFAIPIAIILIYSFLEKGLYGGVEWRPSLAAYKAILNPNFLIVIWRTVYISVIATAICLLLSFPASYAMARSRHQTLFLFLIIIPFWTNSLIRVYAWINLLSTEGLINNVLIKLGIISEPIPMIYNLFSVILVLVYMYLPFAILPLFTAIDRFDFSLLDAARDLGCGRLRANKKRFLQCSHIHPHSDIRGIYCAPTCRRNGEYDGRQHHSRPGSEDPELAFSLGLLRHTDTDFHDRSDGDAR